MRKNFDPSSNTSEYVSCDMISVFPNSADCNSLKDRIIEYYKKKLALLNPQDKFLEEKCLRLSLRKMIRNSNS